MSYAPDIEHRMIGEALARRLADRPPSKHPGCQERTLLLALAAIGYPTSTAHVAAVAGVNRSTAIRHLHDWMDEGLVRRHFDQDTGGGWRCRLTGDHVRVLWEVIDPGRWP